jgi:hypothetical protein
VLRDPSATAEAHMSAAIAKPRAAVNVDLISIITLYLTIACCRIGLSLSGDVETNDVTCQRRDSGQPVYRHFCGRCGSPILATITAAPAKVVMKAGTLDNMEGLQPQTEICTDHAVKWLAPVAGAARFAQNQ